MINQRGSGDTRFVMVDAPGRLGIENATTHPDRYWCAGPNLGCCQGCPLVDPLRTSLASLVNWDLTHKATVELDSKFQISPECKTKCRPILRTNWQREQNRPWQLQHEVFW